jgi:hypothetical protein
MEHNADIFGKRTLKDLARMCGAFVNMIFTSKFSFEITVCIIFKTYVSFITFSKYNTLCHYLHIETK